ncbi:natural cytotoxicity triggering receptor 1-like isoform X2 [Octodon degus]|uniref:Natural cytotoxicity triggering receptor 1 n=1 Tax=Octodon degus TaxID=10160 RepID=A0A6P6DUG2_OCTDE|nr:natural cytotoxicity triggering receptor 1-like isoform X2 [Octodon degus]
MWPVLAALLCLGLCWSQGVSTRKQTLSKPIIWAEPSALVPKGMPVTIWCQGAPDAEEFQLHFEGVLFASGMPKPTVPRCKADILIPTMTSRTAGRYSCSYRSGGRWSEPSDGLDLVVTGMYDTPTLQVHPGPEVTLGESVTLYCHLETATSMFFLLKEGRSSHVREGWGPVQAEFPLGPVTAAHQGTYRCFGSYNSHSWSFPSEPVELVVTGDGNTSFSLLDPTSPAAAADAWEPCAMNTESGAQKEPPAAGPGAAGPGGPRAAPGGRLQEQEAGTSESPRCHVSGAQGKKGTQSAHGHWRPGLTWV